MRKKRERMKYHSQATARKLKKKVIFIFHLVPAEDIVNEN